MNKEGMLTEQENRLPDYLSVFFLCAFFLLSAFDFPFTTLLFLAAAVALRLFSVLHAPFCPRLLALFGIMLFWVAFTLLYTPDFPGGVRFFFRLLLCLLMGYFGTRSRAYVRLFVRAYFVVGIIVLISVYLQFLFPDFFKEFYRHLFRPEAYDRMLLIYQYSGGTPVGICGYTSTTGYLLAMLGAYAFLRGGQCWKEEKKWQAFLSFLLFLLSFAGVMLTGKRSLFLATLVTCFLFLFFYYTRTAARRVAIVAAFALALVLLFLFMRESEIFSRFFGRLTDIGSDFYSSGRDKIFLHTFEWFCEKPLFGHGNGAWSKVYEEAFAHLGGGAHNIYLQLLMEGGVPALLFFGAFFIFNLVAAIRAMRQDREDLLLLFSLATQIVFLIYGCFGNPLYDEILLCVYCLFAMIPHIPAPGEEVAYEN